jgi:hypothetical protein
MIHYFETAAKNFSLHQLESTCHKIDTIPKVRTFIAYIDVTKKNGGINRVYLACDEALMQQIAELFLGETVSDEATLIDFALETANMIIGSAKVVAEEENIDVFSIATPIFEKFDHFNVSSDVHSVLSINDHTAIIAIKEL